MAIHFAFAPDALRARRLDKRMREKLADSLAYLRQALEENTADVRALDELVGAMRAGRIYPPSTFGLYYELASALLNDDFSAALPLLGELDAETPIEGTRTSIMTLDAVLPVANRARYQRLMDTDPATPFQIVSPPGQHAAAAVAQVQSALARLRQTIPEMAGEIQALIRELVLVAGDLNTGSDFAGGSCYMLWGALFINAEAHGHDLAMIEALAHESAHSLLFGFTIDEPLIENPDDELYDSPLRTDPRPMDGIYHATFVLARMHWVLSTLLASGQLSLDERQWVSAALETDRRNFYDGYATVAKHACMTETGISLMRGAVDYMQPFGKAMKLT